MKPTRSLHFIASSIAALTIAHTASGGAYDANTTISSAVSLADGVTVGVSNSNVALTVDNGGALDITAGSMAFGTSNEALVVNGTGILTMCANSGKNVNLNSGSGNSITVQGGGTMALTQASGVSNSGTLYMGSSSALAPNTLTVTGSGSTFTNGNAAWGAGIWLSGSNAQITVSDGGVFTSLRQGIYLGGRWGVNSNNSLTITGAGSQVTTSSTINLTSSGGDSSANMTLTIGAGGVANSTSGNISSTLNSNSNTATITGSGSAWNLGSGNLQLGNNAGASDNTLNVSNGGALNNVGSVLMNGTNNQFNLGSGGAALLSTAAVNTVTLGTSTTRLNINNGRLTARADGALVSGLGSIVLNGAAYISSATPFSNTISTAISGTGSLTKEGTGTLTLTNTNTYTGDTVVSAGTLALGASGTISSSSKMVLNGGNFSTSAVTGVYSVPALTGSGTITGNVSVNNLSIGASPGTITFNNDLTLTSQSLFEINGLTASLYDLAKGGDGLQTVNFGGVLNLVFAPEFSTTGAVKIFDFENYTGLFTTVDVSGLASGYSATFNALDGVATITSVPEPTAALLTGLGLLGLLRRRRC